MARLSGKQRASRIPLDYFKKHDAILRWKLGLSALALLIALGWWATGFSFGGSGLVGDTATGRMRYSHGPVSRVHAMWETKCEACHVAFAPIGQDAWTSSLGMSSREADAKCQSCHKVEGHHEVMAAQEAACANCHRDHRGRDASLVRLADADCTSCHRDLKTHADPGKTAADYADILAFPAKHDEFKLMRQGAKAATDPGTLKFNHALHLSPGLNEAKDGKAVFTWSRLSSDDRDRYGFTGGKLEDGVTLNCASCHRLENGDRPARAEKAGVSALETQPLSGTGAYMKPITYKTDCAACHKLDVAVAVGGSTTNPVVATIAVPHRLQPSELHEMLRNASIGLTLGKEDAVLDATLTGGRPFPGRGPQAASARDQVDRRVKEAERILFGRGKGTCTECHQYKTPGGIREELDPSAKLAAVQIEPTYVPAIWYDHALFDHSAHRAVSCRSCHEGAYPDSGEKASRSSADVLLPGKAACAQCHAPEGRDSRGDLIGGAGHTCVECHRYHGGDRKHGPTMAKDADAMAITRFILGTSSSLPKERP